MSRLPLGALAAVLITSAAPSVAQERRLPEPTLGASDRCYLIAPGLPSVPIVDPRSGPQVLADLLEISTRKDTDALKRLFTSGAIFPVSTGAHVSIVAVKRCYYEVRILDGLFEGRTGLVWLNWVYSSHKLKAGDTCRVRAWRVRDAVIDTVPVADARSGRKAYDDLADSMRELDTDRFTKMVQQGLAFTVKSGTRASVVSTNANFCEVRFVEGDSKDRAAYMPFDMIQPDPPPKVAKSAEENRAYALWLAGEIRRQVETDRRTEEAERAGKERKMTEEQSQAQQVEAARKAAEERRRDEDVRRKAAETARKAEQAADAKLTLAKSLLRDGKADKARVRLEEIVKDYPESKAAEEARTLLKGLP